MTTTTYSPKARFRSLYFGMLRRNLGAGVYLTLAMAFFFPLQYLLELMRQVEMAGDPFRAAYSYVSFYGPAGVHTLLSMAVMAVILLAAPVVLSVVQNNYMHSRRAVDLYHSLPVTRRQLMCANAATVFTLVGLPLLFCYLAVLAIGGGYAASGAIPGLEFLPGAILLDLLGWLVTIGAVIAVMMLVGALVGSTFENFVLGCELLVAGPIVVGINSLLFHAYLTGYTGSVSAKDLAVLTPAALMPARYAEHSVGDPTGFFDVLILLWLGAAAAIFLLALWAYSRRKSELAETSGARGFLGVVIKIIAVYVGASAIGGVFTAVNGNTDLAFVIGVFIGACLTILLVEAVLGRGFRGLKKALPGAGALVAGATALAVALVTGGLGYETRIPAADQIQEASVSYRGRFSYVEEYEAGYQGRWNNTDERNNREYPHYYSYRFVSSLSLASPQSLELVRQYHQALIDCNVRSQEDLTNHYGNYGHLEYRLKKGVLARDYRRFNAAAANILLELEKTPEFREKANPVLRLESGDLEGFQLADRYGLSSTGEQRDQGVIQAVLAALQADMREEDYDRFNSGQARILGYLHFNTGFSGNRGYIPLEQDTFASFSIPILDSYSRTASALAGQGLGDYLREPDLGEITALGIEEYRHGYSFQENSIYALSTWTPRADWSKGDFSYLEEEGAAIRSLLSKAKPYRVGTGKDQGIYLYLTVVNGDQAGVTLQLAWEDVPESIRAYFPDVEEKQGYNYPETIMAQAAVETVAIEVAP